MARADRENHNLETRFTQQVQGRYPWFKDLFLASASDSTRAPFPPLIGALLHTMDHGSIEPSCVILPSKEGFAFSLALIGALGAIYEQFEEVELDQLTKPLKVGTMVRVAPENRVWVVEQDGVVLYDERWLKLRNPTDDQTSYIRETEAFRLTPTDSSRPMPRKGSKIGPWKTSPLDNLLGINTAGNLDIFGTQVILVAPQKKTQIAAEDALMSRLDPPCTPASTLVTWGRVKKNGSTVAKDQSVEPVIATTHSVAYMAEACRRLAGDEKIVIVDGAAGLANAPHAFFDAYENHKLMILSDHSELEEAQLLHKRGCEVWAPDPETVLALLGPADRVAAPVKPAHVGNRNCRDLSVAPLVVSDSRIEILHDLARRAWDGNSDQEVSKLRNLTWRVLLFVAECVGSPSRDTLEAFEQLVEDFESTIQRERSWLRLDVHGALVDFLSIAKDLLATRELGRDKGRALLEYLRDRKSTAIVARNRLSMDQLRSFLTSVNVDYPIYMPHNMPRETAYVAVVMCSWLGRNRVSRLVTKYPSRRVDVLCYSFEKHWLSLYSNRWLKEWTKFRRGGTATSRMTGLTDWPMPSRKTNRQPTRPTTTVGDEHPEDPVSSVLAQRKGRSHDAIEHSQVREARYVGYEGDGYSYLTDSHRIPLLTELILGYSADLRQIPLVSPTDLEIGDYVLFREHGDQDMIAGVAEREMGVQAYARLRELADRWRSAITSCGDDLDEIYKVLRRAGLRRQASTVRTWLYDSGRIGPAEKTDLLTIAGASGDVQLLAGLDDTWNAITNVRTAHRQAGSILSRRLLLELPAHTETIETTPCRVELTLGKAWIVEVEEIAGVLDRRPHGEVNSLRFDDKH